MNQKKKKKGSFKLKSAKNTPNRVINKAKCQEVQQACYHLVLHYSVLRRGIRVGKMSFCSLLSPLLLS